MKYKTAEEARAILEASEDVRRLAARVVEMLTKARGEYSPQEQVDWRPRGYPIDPVPSGLEAATFYAAGGSWMASAASMSVVVGNLLWLIAQLKAGAPKTEPTLGQTVTLVPVAVRLRGDGFDVPFTLEKFGFTITPEHLERSDDLADPRSLAFTVTGYISKAAWNALLPALGRPGWWVAEQEARKAGGT